MKHLVIIIAMLATVLLGTSVPAQTTKNKGKAEFKNKKAPVEAPVEVEEAAPDLTSENSLEACQDKVDNDGDNHVDCDDQDCEIYAVCVTDVPEAISPKVLIVAERVQEEHGGMCVDGIDNDRDGFIDCYESSCHKERFCRRQAYYVPEDPDKAPGLLVSAGLGLSFPNFRGSQITAHSNRYDADIPLDPDMGAHADFKIGYLPVSFIGFGLNLIGGATYGNNRTREFGSSAVSNRYKYEAEKLWVNAGVFVRLQYPFKRFVPYINIIGGYSYSQQRWNVYAPLEDWDNINTRDDDDLNYAREELASESKHFTLALEPGFDVFISSRSVAIGMRAWLPIWATSNPEYDNIGVTLAVTFTPLWREKRKLKPEYENPKPLPIQEIYADSAIVEELEPSEMQTTKSESVVTSPQVSEPTDEKSE